MKVDLEKAYNRISQKFLHEMLSDAGFPVTIIHAVMNCVSSMSI